MPRPSVLSYDRGTLLLHPPPRGSKAWVDHAEWDDRVEKFRIPADHYRPLVEALAAEGTAVDDRARAFTDLPLQFAARHAPHPHQAEALAAWQAAGRRGVIVLPTGAGKTLVAQLALESTPGSTLIVVPTLDLMHQWYAGLLAAFPGATVGSVGRRFARPRRPVARGHVRFRRRRGRGRLGNRFALLVFDEVHHLPAAFTRVIAEYSIAPYRLGLTATPERADGRDRDLETLVGPTVYRVCPPNSRAARWPRSTRSACASP